MSARYSVVAAADTIPSASADAPEAAATIVAYVATCRSEQKSRMKGSPWNNVGGESA